MVRIGDLEDLADDWPILLIDEIVFDRLGLATAARPASVYGLVDRRSLGPLKGEIGR